MSWAVGFDDNWNRDIGYGVPASCDHPGCNAIIDRGLDYVCGGKPYGGEYGCGLHFCGDHLFYRGRFPTAIPQRCERCCDNKPPFPPKADLESWISHKTNDSSWAEWRAEQNMIA